MSIAFGAVSLSFSFWPPLAHRSPSPWSFRPIVYLAVKGQDLGARGRAVHPGLYDSFRHPRRAALHHGGQHHEPGAISDRLLDFCKAAVGRFNGGMAQVDILVSLIFSGMSGSAVADAAGVGKVTINMMIKTGHYTPGFAGAVVAASATIGPIIPPSIPLVMYALVSDTSVGYLFLGGVIPGLVMTVAMMHDHVVDRASPRHPARRGRAAQKAAGRHGAGAFRL